MKKIRIVRKGFLGTRIIERDLPTRWSDLSEKQFILIAKSVSDDLPDDIFFSQLLDLSSHSLPLYFIYKLSDYLSFLQSDEGVDRFFMHRLHDTDMYSPGVRLKGMTFEQFMHVDTMFNRYMHKMTDDNLNMFVANLYIRRCECFVLPEREKNSLFSFRKMKLLQPADNARYIARRVDKHVKFAVFLNYVLIKKWLSTSFPFLFPESGDNVSTGRHGKINIPSVKWLDIFDSFVGDDIAKMDYYRSMPATTAFRIMNRRIRESQKKK